MNLNYFTNYNQWQSCQDISSSSSYSGQSFITNKNKFEPPPFVFSTSTRHKRPHIESSTSPITVLPQTEKSKIIQKLTQISPSPKHPKRSVEHKEKEREEDVSLGPLPPTSSPTLSLSISTSRASNRVSIPPSSIVPASNSISRSTQNNLLIPPPVPIKKSSTNSSIPLVTAYFPSPLKSPASFQALYAPWQKWIMERLTDINDHLHLNQIVQLQCHPTITRKILEDCMPMSTCRNNEDFIKRSAHLITCPYKWFHQWIETDIQEAFKTPRMTCCLVVETTSLVKRYLLFSHHSPNQKNPYTWMIWSPTLTSAPEWITAIMSGMNDALHPCMFRSWPILHPESKVLQSMKMPYEMVMTIAIHLFNKKRETKFLCWNEQTDLCHNPMKTKLDMPPHLGWMSLKSHVYEAAPEEKKQAIQELNEHQTREVIRWLKALEHETEIGLDD